MAYAAYDLPLEPKAEDVANAPEFTEADRRLLLQNGDWFRSLRWLVIAAHLGLALLAWTMADRLAAHGIQLRPGWPVAVAAVLTVFNLAYLAMARARQAAVQAFQTLWLQIVLDLAVLTVVVHYLGSLETFAPFMYLFHIALACIFFPTAQSLLVTVLAMGMYLVCLLLESAGLTPATAIFADSLMPHRNGMPSAVQASYFGSVVFVSGTVWYLASQLARALRQRGEELAATNRRLIAAREERDRHMLRMAHQMKAPLAAIHANTQLLLGGYCGTIPESAIAVIQRIAARCETLSQEIKAMLQLANLRSSAQTPAIFAPIDLPALIDNCLANFKTLAARRNIVLDADLSPASVCGVPDQAAMMLDNVLSNAINYSRDGGRVSVHCRAKTDGGAIVVIRDHGIGIPAEKLSQIFDDYFRTNEAAQHNKSSTGLGLAIVRQAALAGKVRVHVESALGEGTALTLDFPPAPSDATGAGDQEQTRGLHSDRR